MKHIKQISWIALIQFTVFLVNLMPALGNESPAKIIVNNQTGEPELTLQMEYGGVMEHHFKWVRNYERVFTDSVHAPFICSSTVVEVSFTIRGKNGKYSLKKFFINRGDSIVITLVKKPNGIKVRGIGKAFEGRVKVDSLKKVLSKEWKTDPDIKLLDAKSLAMKFHQDQERVEEVQAVYKQCANLLSDEVVQHYRLSEQVRNYYFSFLDANAALASCSQSERIHVKNVFKEHLNEMRNFILQNSKISNLGVLATRVVAWNNIVVYDTVTVWDEPIFESFYDTIKAYYQGDVRESALAALFSLSRPKGAESQFVKCLLDANSFVQDSDLKSRVSILIDRFKPGAQFLDFSLKDTAHRVWSLKDFRGKVVVIDFWFNGCGPCASLAKELDSVVIPFYSPDEVVFVNISLDKKWEKFVELVKAGFYTSKKALNLYTEGLAGDHPLPVYYRIQSAPNVMIIDKYGRMFDPTPSRNADLLRASIDKALQVNYTTTVPMRYLPHE